MSNLNKQYFKTKKTHRKGFNLKGWFLWIAVFMVFIFFVLWYVQSQLFVRKISIPITEITWKNCLLDDEFQLGQIKYTFNQNSVLTKLGKPDSVLVESGYNSDTWYYPDIEIGISNNHIYFLQAKNEVLSTPSGIRIGMAKEDVFEKLRNNYSGKLEIDINEDHVQIVNCSTECYLIMDFKSNRLSNLSIGIDLP